MKLGVVGLGLIGGSIALDLRRCGWATQIIGQDLSREHVSTALDLGIIDVVCSDATIASQCDVIIVSVPVGSSLKVIEDLLSNSSSRLTIFDVGSTKGVIAKHFAHHPKRAQLVLSHPMAGTEFSGPSAAHSGLFENKVAVLCETEKSGEVHLNKVREIYKLLGMRCILMDASAHDLHVAFVSHLSHISSFVLAQTVLEKEKDEEKIFNLASGGLESTVRLAKSSPSMWVSIFEQNRENILISLSDYIMQLQKFQNALQNKKFDELFGVMQSSNEIKRVLSQIQKPNKDSP